MTTKERHSLLKFAILLEGGIGLLGLVLGYFTRIYPLQRILLEADDSLLALVACLPLFLAFLAVSHLPFQALQRIRFFLDRSIWPMMQDLSWLDVALISILAGIGEELFFRGWLEPWIAGYSNPILALVLANLIFALAHFITPTYALFAGLLGAAISGLVLYGENLLIGIIVHAVYDCMALSYYLYLKRREHTAD